MGERRDEALPLYTAVVGRGRAEHWYREGAVPDSVDGRFDMIAAVLAMVLIRLDAEGASAAPVSASLTERFVDDMDGQLRQMGIGDIVVGKHIGRMMSMLGGRIGAYRAGLSAGDLTPALARNLYRAGIPDERAQAHVAAGLTQLHEALATTHLDRLIRGDLP